MLSGIAEAERLGASHPLMAHAVQSRTFGKVDPWKRVEEAGRKCQEVACLARSYGFAGNTILELLAWCETWEPTGLTERALGGKILAFRVQATTWPGDARAPP